MIAALIDMAHIAADTLPYWRDLAVMMLALLVIGCLWFHASFFE